MATSCDGLTRRLAVISFRQTHYLQVLRCAFLLGVAHRCLLNLVDVDLLPLCRVARTIAYLLNLLRVRVVTLLAWLTVNVLEGELRDVHLLALDWNLALFLDYLGTLIAGV